MISVAICLTLLTQHNSLDAILARVNNPREGDRERIAKFGDAAFVKLYPLVQRSLKNPPEKDAPYYILRTQLDYLTECASESRTSEMIALYQVPFDLSQQYLISWLSRIGTARQGRSIFVNALIPGKQYNPLPACQGLMRIGDPSAIDLVGQVVLDPEVGDDVRSTACRQMAASEKPQALAVVRKALVGSKTLPELTQRRNLPKLDSKDVLSRGIGKDGVEKALIKWDALGGPEDLWVVTKDGDHWQQPIFIGINTYWPIYQMGPAKGFEKYQAKMKEFIEGKGWFKKFAENSEIAKDSDGDGYSDTVEMWLGLNRLKADTDGDGIADGVDRNPFYRARTLSNSEKALQAALASFTFTRSWFNSNVIVGFEKGILPIELTSGGGLVLPRFYPENPSTGKLYGKWLSVVRVEPDKNQRNEFEVQIIESGGFYENLWLARVKKIGDEWFCTDARVMGSAVS